MRVYTCLCVTKYGRACVHVSVCYRVRACVSTLNCVLQSTDVRAYTGLCVIEYRRACLHGSVCYRVRACVSTLTCML